MNRLAILATLSTCVATAGLLAGCGGDSSPPPPPPPPPSDQMPTSAVVSDATLEAFAIGLAPTETTEPLKLDQVPTFPTSETEEPVVVN
jgi:hypothetical protein